MDKCADTETLLTQVDQLKARIYELEDFQQRLEDSAAETIQLAEDLELARAETETALRKEREYKETIRKLALFDPLTGVANRNLFQQRFQEAINASSRDGTSVALMLFDVDNFKGINDTFGHPVGDDLLRFVSRNLIEATRDTDTVARLGGDEFAIILTKVEKSERAGKVAARIANSVSKSVNIQGALVESGTSIGISFFPRDGMDQDELLRAADIALYAAKENGKGSFVFFDGELDARARALHVLDSDLRLAIVREEFLLHFQPQMKYDRHGFTGVEALIRWQHPSRGLLGPADFINTAEQSGLLPAIGKLVLDNACRQYSRWVRAGCNPNRIAVNVSPMQFQNVDFVETVRQALSTNDLDPRCLELEITETIMMKGFDQVVGKMDQLRELGVSISIDDFGTGYSSLAYLKKLPIQKLKIDKSFVDNIPEDKNNMAIVAAIVNMSRSLGIDIVAEGIESGIQMHALLEHGCDQFQGFLISKPLPEDVITARLSATPCRAANGASHLQTLQY